MNNKDVHYMLCAKQIALLSKFKPRVGCVVVYNKTIISSGYNDEKTHPTQRHYNAYRFDKKYSDNEVIPKLHAEISALSKIQYLDIDWSKAKIYVYRILGNKQGLARPCNACMQFIRDLGIKHIFYSTYENLITEEFVE